MTRYLEGEEIARDELRAALRQATIAGKLVPVLCGTALREQGRPAAARRGRGLPAVAAGHAAGRGHQPAHRGAETARGRRRTSRSRRWRSRSSADPYVGKLAYIRVYSGGLKAGSYVFNSTKDQRERIGRLLQMHANHREDIERGRGRRHRGGRRACKSTVTGDTLCDPDNPIVLEAIKFPEPVIDSRDRAEDARPTRTRWASRCSPGRGRPDLPRAHGPGDRPDDDLRAWASCTWK